MKRHLFSICLILGFLALSLVVVSPIMAQTLTPTPTRTPTLWPSASSTAIPGADWVGTPLSGAAPLTVQFTALNGNILSSCSWTFGDGTSQGFAAPTGGILSVCPSVSHVYTTAGSYTVKLSVMKVTGATNSLTRTDYIQVSGTGLTPTLTFTPRPGCGTVVVVTSTPSPTFTPTPRTATATPTPSCSPIYITATPGGPILTPTRTPTVTPVSTNNDLPYPDLTVSSVTYIASGPVCANIPPNVEVVVTNIGAFPANGSFLVSMPGVQTQTVNGLAAGQSVTLIFSASSGPATVDSTNVITETNESNNSLQGYYWYPTQAPTCTPTGGLTPTRTPTGPTPTRTRTPTATVILPDPTPTQTLGCSPVTSSITAPFTYDGAGTFCWQSNNLGSYINSWNLTSLTVNGVNESNLYVAAGSLPAKIGGYWYVGYNSAVTWGHFEAK
jgi:PKD repeat protein